MKTYRSTLSIWTIDEENQLYQRTSITGAELHPMGLDYDPDKWIPYKSFLIEDADKLSNLDHRDLVFGYPSAMISRIPVCDPGEKILYIDHIDGTHITTILPNEIKDHDN